MSQERVLLRTVHDIAARAENLCDEAVRKLGRGDVLGDAKAAEERRREGKGGGIVGTGDTPEAARRDFELRLVILLFLLFARDLFKSIRRLEAAGSFVPCNVLARSLFEAMVNTVYIISGDPAKSARQFLAHEYAQRYAWLCRCRGAGLPVDPEMAEQIEREWGEAKDTYELATAKGRPKKRWHGKDMRELCKQLAERQSEYRVLAKEYEGYYRPDSELCHASVQALKRYAERDETRGIWLLCPEPSASWRFWLLARCTHHALRILAVANDALSLAIRSDVLQLQQDIDELAAECEGASPA